MATINGIPYTAGTLTLEQRRFNRTVARMVEVRAYIFEHLALHRPLNTYSDALGPNQSATDSVGWYVRHQESGLGTGDALYLPLRTALAFVAAIEEATPSWPQQDEEGRWTVNLKPLYDGIAAAAEKVGLVRGRYGGWEKAGKA